MTKKIKELHIADYNKTVNTLLTVLENEDFQNLKKNPIIEITRASEDLKDDFYDLKEDYKDFKTLLNEELEKLKSVDSLRYNKINYDVFESIDVINQNIHNIHKKYKSKAILDEKRRRGMDKKISVYKTDINDSVDEKIYTLSEELSGDILKKYNTLKETCDLMKATSDEELSKLSEKTGKELDSISEELDDVYKELMDDYESQLKDLSEHLFEKLIETNEDVLNTENVITEYINNINDRISKTNKLYESETNGLSSLLTETVNSLNSFKSEQNEHAQTTLKYIKSVEENYTNYKEDVANNLARKLNSGTFNKYVKELKEKFKEQNLSIDEVKENINSLADNIIDKISLTNETALNSEQINSLIIQLLESKFEHKLNDVLDEQVETTKTTISVLTEDIQNINEKIEKFVKESFIKTEYGVNKQLEDITNKIKELSERKSLTIEDFKQFLKDNPDLFEKENQEVISDYMYKDGWLFFKKGDSEWDTPIKIKGGAAQSLPIMGSSGLGGGAVGGSLDKYYLTKLFDVNNTDAHIHGKFVSWDEDSNQFKFIYKINDDGTTNTDIWTAEKIMEYVYSEGNEIIEVDTYEDLPEEGEVGKYYVTLDDENVYRWSGSIYINMNDPDLMLKTGTNSDIDYLDFNISPTIPSHAKARLHWNDDDKTLEFGLNSYVTLQIGQEEVELVKNNTSFIILNGMAVIQDGSDSIGNKQIKLADVSDDSCDCVIGITTQEIGIGEYGFITTRGKVRDYNTDSFNLNDIVYVNPSNPGYLTNIKPDAPNLIVRIGMVTKKDLTEGVISLNLSIIPKSVMFSNAGVYHLPTYTEDSGNIILSDGTYVFALDDDGLGPLEDFNIDGGTYTLIEGTNYIFASYNAGSPIISVSSSASTINQLDIIPIYTIFKDNLGILRIIDWDYGAKLIGNKISDRLVRTERFKPEIGDFDLCEISTNIVTLTDGHVWAGHSRIYLNSVNSTTDTAYLWVNTNGTWSKNEVNTYNNTQYNDPITGLQSLLPNQYTVNWILRSIASNREEVGIILGAESYKLIEAQESPMPELPPGAGSNAMFVGRIIVKLNEPIAEQIDSAFTENYGFVTSSNHNNLLNIDAGDTVTPFYGHLTEAELTEVQNLSDTYVPYKNAATDLDMGLNEIVAGKVYEEKLIYEGFPTIFKNEWLRCATSINVSTASYGLFELRWSGDWLYDIPLPPGGYIRYGGVIQFYVSSDIGDENALSITVVHCSFMEPTDTRLVKYIRLITKDRTVTNESCESYLEFYVSGGEEQHFYLYKYNSYGWDLENEFTPTPGIPSGYSAYEISTDTNFLIKGYDTEFNIGKDGITTTNKLLTAPLINLPSTTEDTFIKFGDIGDGTNQTWIMGEDIDDNGEKVFKIDHWDAFEDDIFIIKFDTNYDTFIGGNLDIELNVVANNLSGTNTGDQVIGDYLIVDTENKYNSTKLSEVFDEIGETRFWNGFDLRDTDSLGDIDWDEGTRTISLAVKSGQTNFHFWTNGKKITKTTTQSIVIDDVTGVYYVYFDNDGNVGYVERGSFDLSAIYEYALFALVRWNATQQKGNAGNEQHGIRMSSATHTSLHLTVGAMYEYGLGIEGLVDGNIDYTQTTVGAFWDEDIRHTAIAETTHPFLYRLGTTGEWTIGVDGSNNVLSNNVVGLEDVFGSGNYVYNEWTGATWQLTYGSPTNDHYIYFFVANPNIETNQIFKIVGHNGYANVAAARAAIETEKDTLNIEGLPGQEFVFLYAVIINRSGVVQTLADGGVYYDLRTLRGGSSGSSEASNYAGDILTDTTNFDNLLSSTDTNVQLALETINDNAVLYSYDEITKDFEMSGLGEDAKNEWYNFATLTFTDIDFSDYIILELEIVSAYDITDIDRDIIRLRVSQNTNLIEVLYNSLGSIAITKFRMTQDTTTNNVYLDVFYTDAQSWNSVSLNVRMVDTNGYWGLNTPVKITSSVTTLSQVELDTVQSIVHGDKIFSIDSDFNVGIGTNNPDEKIEIWDSIDEFSGLSIQNIVTTGDINAQSGIKFGVGQETVGGGGSTAEFQSNIYLDNNYKDLNFINTNTDSFFYFSSNSIWVDGGDLELNTNSNVTWDTTYHLTHNGTDFVFNDSVNLGVNNLILDDNSSIEWGTDETLTYNGTEFVFSDGINTDFVKILPAGATGFTRAMKVGIGSTSTNSGSYIEFSSSTADNYGAQIGGIRDAGAGSNALVFLTGFAAQVERMRISNGGDITITEDLIMSEEKFLTMGTNTLHYDTANTQFEFSDNIEVGGGLSATPTQSSMKSGLIVNEDGNTSTDGGDFRVETVSHTNAISVVSDNDEVTFGAKATFANIVNLTPRTTPSSGTIGDVYMDNVTNKLNFCTSTGTPGTWETITSV